MYIEMKLIHQIAAAARFLRKKKVLGMSIIALYAVISSHLGKKVDDFIEHGPIYATRVTRKIKQVVLLSARFVVPPT